MVIDLKYRLKNGVPVLMAYMPKAMLPKITADGYVNFNAEEWEWREIEKPRPESRPNLPNIKVLDLRKKSAN